MFFRRRCSGFLFRMLMVILGIKFLTKQRHCHEDHTSQKARARAFRQKLREAVAVWDDESFDQPHEDNSATTE